MTPTQLYLPDDWKSWYFLQHTDCGHAPTPPHHFHANGTPTTTGRVQVAREVRVGDRTFKPGDTVCLDCANTYEQACLRQDGRGVLHLSCADGVHYRVVSSTGYLVSTKVALRKKWINNWHDTRVSVRFDYNGEVWSGIGPGVGSLLRCQRTKYRTLWE